MAKIKPMMVLPPVIFLGLAGLFLWGMNQKDRDALPSTREGGPAPALTVTEFSGHPGFDAEDLASGEVILVNFWASWCGPCRAEHPQLEAMADEGMVIYGINYKDEAANAQGFLDELGNPYAKLMADVTGRTGLDWGLYGVPETFVIDGDGQVVKRFAGPITTQVLETVIRPAIASASGE